MKINGPGQVQSNTIKKTAAKKGASGSSFAGALSGGAPVAAHHAVHGASPLTSVDALLSLQEAPDATNGRSKGLKRADEMLDMLEDIQRGILLGSISTANLRTLANMARNQRGNTGDRRLDGILADIELRAEVELAKLGL